MIDTGNVLTNAWAVFFFSAVFCANTSIHGIGIDLDPHKFYADPNLAFKTNADILFCVRKNLVRARNG
jgi:hypothetical protein